MKLQHQTEVAASPEDVWTFLQDTRAVVRCLPGAELVDELGDDRYQGVLRVAVGPLKMAYAGDVSVVERNAVERQMVLDATGRDKRGAGAVQAHVQLTVSPINQGARIDVTSDLDLTGRIASLGRGVRDVSNQMFVQFAGQLGAHVERSEGIGAAGGAGIAAAHGSAAHASAGTFAGMDSSSGPGPGTADGAFAGPQRRRSLAAFSESVDSGGQIKVFALIWAVTRERFADFLDRLSSRVRPH